MSAHTSPLPVVPAALTSGLAQRFTWAEEVVDLKAAAEHAVDTRGGAVGVWRAEAPHGPYLVSGALSAPRRAPSSPYAL